MAEAQSKDGAKETLNPIAESSGSALVKEKPKPVKITSYQINWERQERLRRECTTQTILLPKVYMLRCGSGQRSVFNPKPRGAMARNFAAGLFPCYGGVLTHPFL